MKFENKGKWLQQIAESAQKNEDLSSKIKSLFKDKESEIDSTGKYNGEFKALDGYSYAVWLRGDDAEYDSPVAKFLRTKGFTSDKKLYYLPFERGAKVYILESAQKNEDKEGMNALKKLTKENKFIVYCDGHAKYCKTRQEAEAHAKAIKAGQVKDLLGRTVKPTEPVKIEEIHESAQKNESAYISFQECKTLYKLLGKFEKVILNEYPGPSNYKREYLDEVDSIKALLKDMWDGQRLESAQINESRNWKVAVELSAPDNMNNAYVEDTVEHFLDKSGLTVFDVTATRK